MLLLPQIHPKFSSAYPRRELLNLEMFDHIQKAKSNLSAYQDALNTSYTAFDS
jgi:hypothetical protein